MNNTKTRKPDLSAPVYPDCYCGMCMRSEARKAYERHKNWQLTQLVENLAKGEPK